MKIVKCRGKFLRTLVSYVRFIFEISIAGYFKIFNPSFIKPFVCYIIIVSDFNIKLNSSMMVSLLYLIKLLSRLCVNKANYANANVESP